MSSLSGGFEIWRRGHAGVLCRLMRVGLVVGRKERCGKTKLSASWKIWCHVSSSGLFSGCQKNEKVCPKSSRVSCCQSCGSPEVWPAKKCQSWLSLPMGCEPIGCRGVYSSSPLSSLSSLCAAADGSSPASIVPLTSCLPASGCVNASSSTWLLFWRRMIGQTFSMRGIAGA